MHLNQLWAFYQVAKYKSFSQAAEALFLSQPSVSNQVKLLEESCGLKLFDRTGRSVELTNAGEILLSYAERIFNLAKEADSVIEEIKGLKAGGIRISASNTFGAYYLPDILDLFRKKHPQIEIRMNVGYTQTVVEDVLSFRSDLGLIGREIAHPNIVAIPLLEEELILIVPPDHPFAGRGEIDLAELQAHPFIMSEVGSGVRDITEKILAGAKVSVRVVMELGENEAMKRAVASGLGITLISATVAQRELEAGQVRAVRLSGTQLLRKFNIILHKDKYISKLIRAFMDDALSFLAIGNRPRAEAMEPGRRRKRPPVRE
ncbi:MAG: LysR family transcriptional regulator [Deltaproteobacteria bacterium]|nr:LysR family transcriptional regulator [Deltaproteobacteria bacterium]